MPLPLLAWAAIGVTGLFGAGKTIGAIMDNSEADDINEEANSIVERAKAVINTSKDASGASLKALGARKAYVLDGEIKRFLDFFTQLKNVDFKDTPGLEEFAKFRIDAQDLKGLRDMSDFAGSLVGGTVTGATAGGMAVLGGLVAAPALAALGLFMGASASKNLDNARSNRA